jgi:uncharacterized membrane protein YqiK
MVFNILGGMVGLYRIVPADEAHVRIMGNSKEVFMSREYNKVKKKSAYWVVPFITKITRLPLTNIRIDVPDVKLNDSDMAKFMCDIVCFVNISDPLLAAERTGITVTQKRYEGVEDLSEDFRAIMESIGRTVGTKQTILEIYKDRNKLDTAVTAEVSKVFPEWGLELVDLEIKDIKDATGSSIISDIEKKQAAVINSDARVKVAEQNNRAAVIEAEKTRDTQMKVAETEEEWKKRQTKKEQEIAIAVQEKDKMTAQKQLEANTAVVEANRKLKVGNADVDREAITKVAEAEKSRLTLVAEGKAKEVESLGMAEAGVIKAKKVADAEGTEKLALAQQKFNEAASTIEVIKATKDVQIAYAMAYQKAFEKANITIVAGSTSEIISGGLIGSVKVGPKEGMSVQQFLGMNPDLANLIKTATNPKEKKNKPVEE